MNLWRLSPLVNGNRGNHSHSVSRTQTEVFREARIPVWFTSCYPATFSTSSCEVFCWFPATCEVITPQSISPWKSHIQIILWLLCTYWYAFTLFSTYHVIFIQLELFIFITYFSTVIPLTSCFLSCRPFVINATFSIGLVVPISAWNMIFKSIDFHEGLYI